MLPMVSVLAGAMLGSRNGAMSMTLYALLGLLGVPVFATAPFGGLGYILKPSFGFVPGFILAAWLTGYIIEKFKRSTPVYIGASVAGVISIYLVGVPYLWFVMNYYIGKSTSLYSSIQLGMLYFIVPDLIKAVISGILAASVAKRIKI
jgi:biotin transport system substrate-specific component